MKSFTELQPSPKTPAGHERLCIVQRTRWIGVFKTSDLLYLFCSIRRFNVLLVQIRIHDTLNWDFPGSEFTAHERMYILLFCGVCENVSCHACCCDDSKILAWFSFDALVFETAISLRTRSLVLRLTAWNRNNYWIIVAGQTHGRQHGIYLLK